MNKQELIEALAPVKAYFKSRDLSENTVLAAHMRALGVAPSGDRWALAKGARSAGMPFAEAARIGAELDGGRVQVLGQSSASKAPAAEPTLQVSEVTERTPQRVAPGALDWFPQPFEPGVMQGNGVKKLLGTPHVSMEDMLVRETAQNSWDAREPGQHLEFVLNLRTLGSAAVETLRDEVFVGEAPGTRIRDALEHDDLWVIEISDRGTVGLGGPVRSDQSLPPGSVKNFIDFAYNIGATKDDPASGGTYGFGKSIAYLVSELGALVIWSRCRTADGPEDRLIASAVGDVFDQDGLRYTGRHWWGRTVDGWPEPLVGERAAELGGRLFARSFVGDELGTSLLILEPSLGAVGPDDDAEVLVEAVMKNLWPKLVSDGNGSRLMDIHVQVDGVDHEIPDPRADPTLSGPVACLQAIRAKQAGKEVPPSLFRIDVQEIYRYNDLLGHLALTKYPFMVPKRSETDREPAHSVTLMRNNAELVVRQLEGPALTEAGFQWAGVFKPIADVDPTFAASEPPAHDDWVPDSLQNRVQKSKVKVALDKIRGESRAFIAPDAQSEVGRSAISTAAVGDMLASFLGGVDGSAPSRRPRTGGGGGARSAVASLQVEPVEWRPSTRPGWTRTTLSVRAVGGPVEGARVSMAVRVGVDGATERQPQPEFVQEIGWDGTSGDDATLRISSGGEARYVFEARDDIAVDVIPTIVKQDDR